MAALGTALALAIVLEAAVPAVLEGSGLLLAAVGIVLVAVAAFSKTDPHDGLATWMATIFGALYISLLSFVIRLGDAAPLIPSDAPLDWLGGERALDPVADPLGVRPMTPAPTWSASSSAARSS